MHKLAQPLIVAALLFLGITTGCKSSQAARRTDEAAVREVLDQQVREWNSGNLAGFMETYAKSDRTRFASGGNLQRGWQSVFDRYRTWYPDQATMGRTIFSDLEVELLSPDSAIAFGKWRLERAAGDQPHGLFTLILRKRPEGWRIVHDHTSVADPK